jgi:hypothetical protein
MSKQVTSFSDHIFDRILTRCKSRKTVPFTQPRSPFSSWDFRYRHLLAEKGAQLGESAGKLRGGLQKLDETREQVGAMQVVCQEKKVTVAKAKKDCEELLVEIVQEKRVVDEQERQVGPRHRFLN